MQKKERKTESFENKFLAQMQQKFTFKRDLTLTLREVLKNKFKFQQKKKILKTYKNKQAQRNEKRQLKFFPRNISAISNCS
jgi:hypothetical protein